MNAAQKHAIDLIATAYRDCANMVESLSNGVDLGMPSLSTTEKLLCEVLLKTVAGKIRNKSNNVHSHLSLAVSQSGEA